MERLLQLLSMTLNFPGNRSLETPFRAELEPQRSMRFSALVPTYWFILKEGKLRPGMVI